MASNENRANSKLLEAEESATEKVETNQWKVDEKTCRWWQKQQNSRIVYITSLSEKDRIFMFIGRN